MTQRRKNYYDLLTACRGQTTAWLELRHGEGLAMNTCNKPLAAKGWTAYRLKGRYGWIMIGAAGTADAMREAARSTDNPQRENLEVWDGTRYIPA